MHFTNFGAGVLGKPPKRFWVPSNIRDAVPDVQGEENDTVYVFLIATQGQSNEDATGDQSDDANKDILDVDFGPICRGALV